MLAWHFLPPDGRLRYDDGRAPQDGETLHAEGPISLCHNGMHASRSLLDALSYAPGLTLCRVAVTGDVVEGDDKIVGRSRRILWRIDARPVVVEFARWCAERAKVRAAGYADAANAASAERKAQRAYLTKLVRAARRDQQK